MLPTQPTPARKTDHLSATASAVREGLAARRPATGVDPADVPVEEVIELAEPFLAGAGGADLLELLLELHRPDASLGDGRVLCEHDLYAWPCPTADLCAAWARPER